MTIREAGKDIVRKSYGGEKIHIELDFANRDGEEDETETGCGRHEGSCKIMEFSLPGI